MAALDKGKLDEDKTRAMADKARSERAKPSVTDRLIVLIVMAVLCGIGLLLALVVGAASNEAPTCGGNTMARDDRCVIHKGGSSESYSYQEMLDREGTTDTVIRGFGWFLAWPSGLLLIIALLPGAPWGSKVAGPCPKCGRTKLRKKEITHGGCTGTVTLCTSGCRFASVEQP